MDPDYWKGEVFAYVGLPQNLKDLNVASEAAAGLECVGRRVQRRFAGFRSQIETLTLYKLT